MRITNSRCSVILVGVSILASNASATISGYAAIGINSGGTAVVGGVTRSDEPDYDQYQAHIIGVQMMNFVTPLGSGGEQTAIEAELPSYPQAYTSTAGSTCVEDGLYYVKTRHYIKNWGFTSTFAVFEAYYIPLDCGAVLITEPPNDD